MVEKEFRAKELLLRVVVDDDLGLEYLSLSLELILSAPTQT